LLERFVPDNEPLAGDLVEAWRGRSDAWFWRQVLLAVFMRTIVHVRTCPRTTAERLLVATALLALIGFQAVVVASLMNHLVVLTGSAGTLATGRYQAWQGYAAAPSFVLAFLIGGILARLHDHRVMAVFVASAGATAAAFVNLYLFVPDALRQPFAPDAAQQIAMAAVFVGGLFAGMVWRSRCEPLAPA
jgi:hypothetical protein